MRLIALLAVWGLLTASQATAQTICAPRDKFVEHLGKRHKEVVTTRAVINDGRLLEVLTSPAGTWTMIVVDGRGRACFMGAGDGWQPVEPSDEGSRS